MTRAHVAEVAMHRMRLAPWRASLGGAARSVNWLAPKFLMDCGRLSPGSPVAPSSPLSDERSRGNRSRRACTAAPVPPRRGPCLPRHATRAPLRRPRAPVRRTRPPGRPRDRTHSTGARSPLRRRHRQTPGRPEFVPRLAPRAPRSDLEGTSHWCCTPRSSARLQSIAANSFASWCPQRRRLPVESLGRLCPDECCRRSDAREDQAGCKPSRSGRSQFQLALVELHEITDDR